MDKKNGRLPKEPPIQSPGLNDLEDAHIIFVADEAHFLDVGPLRDGKHLIDQLIAGGGVRLQVKLRNRIHLLRDIDILPKLVERNGIAVPKDLALRRNDNLVLLRLDRRRRVVLLIDRKVEL